MLFTSCVICWMYKCPVNLVFMLMFCFVLLVLLSLSIGVSQLADKCKRLTQENAILEKRVRIWRKNSAANNPAKGV